MNPTVDHSEIKDHRSKIKNQPTRTQVGESDALRVVLVTALVGRRSRGTATAPLALTA